MTALLILLHATIVVAITLRILVRENLSPPARLAWFIVITALPYLGPLVYFLFGEAQLERLSVPRHADVFRTLRARHPEVHGSPSDVAVIDERYRPAFRYGASVNGFYTVGGNTARLLGDAQDTLDSLIADIDGARDRVHVLYYIWLTDGAGTRIADALARAAERGVCCRVMADGLGSRGLIGGALWDKMQAAGVELAVALPINRPVRTILTSRLDLRNHRKITVIDGRIVYCGSRNAADPEFRVKPKFAPWVDIMMRLEGPIAAQSEVLFLSDWLLATGQDDLTLDLQVSPRDGGFPALVVGDGPTERAGATPQLFATLLAGARDRVTITTPYFVPDATVLSALYGAAWRGVQVTLVFPKRNDSWIVAAASHSYYNGLLKAGCRIFEYGDGLLHAKTLTVDGMVSLIGSSNLDLRSFDLNYENNILFQDAALTKAIEDRQADYIAACDPISPQEVHNWPIRRRIWNNVVATVGPIL